MKIEFSQSTLLYLTFILLTFPAFSHAYIDPGSGSIILQLIVAGIFGSILFFKLLWQRIVHFFSNLFSSSAVEEPDRTEDQ